MILRILFVSFFLFQATAQAQNLRIFHIDVEQADATLIVSPSGDTLLVDSGKNGHGARIKAVMDEAEVNQIDHYVTTHYHEDHFGGVDDLVLKQKVLIHKVYDRGFKGSLKKKARGVAYKGYQREAGWDAERLDPGETINLDPEMTVTCIASNGLVTGDTIAPPKGNADENNLSVALLIEYGEFSFFIGGDIHHETEDKIAEQDLAKNVEVYQSNHHGSHTSSSLDFMKELKPSVIVISNGSHGGHQHPRKVTLETYKDLSPEPTVFQTNKYLKGGNKGGNVPDEFIADISPKGKDGTIKITVEKGEDNFTVKYRNKTKTFAIK